LAVFHCSLLGLLWRSFGNEAGSWNLGFKSESPKWTLIWTLQDGRGSKLYQDHESCFWLFAEENALQVFTPEYEGLLTLNMVLVHIQDIYRFLNSDNILLFLLFSPSCGKLKILSARMIVTGLALIIVVI